MPTNTPRSPDSSYKLTAKDAEKYAMTLGPSFWNLLDNAGYSDNVLLFLKKVAYYFVQNRPGFLDICEAAPLNEIFADYGKVEEVDHSHYKGYCDELCEHYLPFCSPYSMDEKFEWKDEWLDDFGSYSGDETNYKDLFHELLDCFLSSNDGDSIVAYFCELDDVAFSGDLPTCMVNDLFDHLCVNILEFYSGVSSETVYSFFMDSVRDRRKYFGFRDESLKLGYCGHAIKDILPSNSQDERCEAIIYFLANCMISAGDKIKIVCSNAAFLGLFRTTPVIPHAKFADIYFTFAG